MSLPLRSAAIAVAALYALVVLAPAASAALDFTVSSNGKELAGLSNGADGSPTSIEAKALFASVLRLGPLDYVLEQAENLVDQARTGGMQCVYDTGSDRDSLVCFCVELTWDCHDTEVTKWTCYASAGPLRNTQVGLVCLPPRVKA